MYYLDEKKLPYNIRELTYRLKPNDEKQANQYYHILVEFKNRGRKYINPKAKQLFKAIENKYGIWFSEYIFEG